MVTEKMIEAAARAILIAKFGDASEAFYQPVPDDFPEANRVREKFARRLFEADVEARAALEAALSAQVQDVATWQSMDSAPKDGKHCLLAVRSSCFVYAVQGAFMMGKWENSADIKSEPLCWMPLTRIPQFFLPWTDEFAAAAPAAKQEEKP